MNLGRVEIPYGAQNLIIESGKLAKQANGAVTVTCGGTVVLVTACMSPRPKVGTDFFPLMVEYQEKTYAAGRIPGGFFKREGRPTEKEILSARVIDRPIRPLFPEGMYHEVQVVASVLSSDGEYDPDVLALVGASAALVVSDIPFNTPLGAVRVGMVNGQFVINPTYKEREDSPLDLTVVGHSEGIIMMEGEAKEIPEEKIIEAMHFAYDAILPIAVIQKELVKSVGKKKAEIQIKLLPEDFVAKVKDMASSRLREVYRYPQKEEREGALNELLDDLTKDLTVFAEFQREGSEITPSDIKLALEKIEYEEVRRIAFEEKRRSDGRGFKDIRPISCEVNVLPRTHGSSLFTRGQTQSLAVTTLGTRLDEQMIEALEGKSYKSFMLHYNFPSFSVGETKPMRGPGRREIGHGALAAKSIEPILPSKDEFPYTIRVVSEILESNGSSSMATVCASTLSLMDAGVPIKGAVAGISIGLISAENEADSILLTDIMGVEDHFGDMDYKIAGTRKGVTAIQLDLKIKSISLKLLEKGLQQAKEARFFILDKMHAAISMPRHELSTYAPRIVTIKVNTEKIGEIIGPGGKMIRKIIEETGVASIDIDDDGKVTVASPNKDAVEKAVKIINSMTEDPVVGKTYPAKVTRVMNFGAFVEFLPGREGLVHVSELSDKYVKDASQAVKVGDEFKVKLIEIDQLKRMNLSKKQAE